MGFIYSPDRGRSGPTADGVQFFFLSAMQGWLTPLSYPTRPRRNGLIPKSYPDLNPLYFILKTKPRPDTDTGSSRFHHPTPTLRIFPWAIGTKNGLYGHIFTYFLTKHPLNFRTDNIVGNKKIPTRTAEKVSFPCPLHLEYSASKRRNFTYPS